MTEPLPPQAGSWLIPEWREQHPKVALGCDLIVELGFDPADVLSRRTRVRDVLDIEGDRCVRLEVLDRNDRGGIQWVHRPVLGWRAMSHVEFVDVEPERLAKYRADIEALG